jgi:hypothetical protein
MMNLDVVRALHTWLGEQIENLSKFSQARQNLEAQKK